MHSIMKHLIKIVDMYLDEEKRHYSECIIKGNESEKKDHIFHSLLEVAIWIKTHHTMNDELSFCKEDIDE